MSLDHFLDLFFRSNVLVIEVLFGMVLVGIIFLTFRSFARPESAASDASLQSLEAGIKKILDNYTPNSNAPASSATPALEGGDGNGIMEEMATQIERLKLQLMQKTEEVEQLKANGGATPLDPALFQESGSAPAAAPAAATSAAPAASAAGDGNTAALEEKIKDLEARLSEYSIIEDDIADLSFYKEETVRLQGEVDKLKAKLAEYEAGGAPSPTVGAAASEVAPSTASVSPLKSVPEPVNSNDEPSQTDLMAEEIDSALKGSEQNAETASLTNSAPASSVDDDIMAEFERAVAEQKAISASQKTATEVPAAPVEEPTAEAEGPAEGGINLDKMLSEVHELPEQTEESVNVLEQALDTDKLLEEATGMEKIDTEALNDFDKFLKKEGA